MEYFNSFEFWVHVVWASSAVSFGLTLGYFLYIGVMDLADMLLEILLNFKFKKVDKEK